MVRVMICRKYRDIDAKFGMSTYYHQGKAVERTCSVPDRYNETAFAHVLNRLGESDITMENGVQAIYVTQSRRVQR
jgi:hypothetical protein